MKGSCGLNLVATKFFPNQRGFEFKFLLPPSQKIYMYIIFQKHHKIILKQTLFVIITFIPTDNDLKKKKKKKTQQFV